MSYRDSYTAADAADDQWAEIVQEYLAELVEPVMVKVRALDQARNAGNDQPHPWTWERHLLAIEDEDEDALHEELEEHFRDEADDNARNDGAGGPCCNQFSCPCGNTNNVPD